MVSPELWQIYPDYQPSGAGNLLGGTVQIDQAYIMQTRSRPGAAACNDNGAWRGSAFRFADGAAERKAA